MFFPLSTDRKVHIPGPGDTAMQIPNLKAALKFCDQFPCGQRFVFLQSPHPFLYCFGRHARMCPSSADAADVMNVLIADSNRMQAQLLASALRRHSEFRINSCQMDTVPIL